MIIAITAQKGGTGKTTTAATMAAGLTLNRPRPAGQLELYL